MRTEKLFPRREPAAAEPAAEAVDPQRQVETRDQLDHLVAALEQLPPACREAFLMNRIDGLTHAQIAAKLGISTKSVQRYIERALRHCLQELDP